MHWPVPVLSPELEGDRGPVLITIEYRIPLAHRSDFLDAVTGMAGIRRRDGAYDWDVYEDAADPGRFVEPTSSTPGWSIFVSTTGLPMPTRSLRLRSAASRPRVSPL